jgi:hypothetical protein
MRARKSPALLVAGTARRVAEAGRRLGDMLGTAPPMTPEMRAFNRFSPGASRSEDFCLTGSLLSCSWCRQAILDHIDRNGSIGKTPSLGATT